MITLRGGGTHTCQFAKKKKKIMASTSVCGLLLPLHDDEIPDEFSAAAETRLYFLLLLFFSPTAAQPRPSAQRAEQVKILPAPGEF